MFPFVLLALVFTWWVGGEAVTRALDYEKPPPSRYWPKEWLEEGVPPLGRYDVLTSPHYPRYVVEEWNYECKPDGDKINFVCIDFDLPPWATVVIKEGEYHSQVFTSGAPPRPVVWMTSQTLKIELAINSSLMTHVTEVPHVGFKCFIWRVPGEEGLEDWLPIPNTTCPGAIQFDEKSRSGTVSLGPPLPFNANPGYLNDCIWRIKVPKIVPNQLQSSLVYIRVTDMLINGLVEIRAGNSSAAKLLASNAHKGPELTALNQPDEGFISRDDLYVRVVKRANEGFFTFIYGEFSYHNQYCSSVITGGDTGFHCRSMPWCIPSIDVCNSILNCPNGEDELEENCVFNKGREGSTDNSSADTFSTAFPPFCPTGWKLCHGRCVNHIIPCPSDGSCPKNQVACDGGRTCFTQEQWCDGKPHCEDGGDENVNICHNMPPNNPYWSLVGACVVAIANLLCCCVGCLKLRQQRHLFSRETYRFIQTHTTRFHNRDRAGAAALAGNLSGHGSAGYVNASRLTTFGLTMTYTSEEIRESPRRASAEEIFGTGLGQITPPPGMALPPFWDKGEPPPPYDEAILSDNESPPPYSQLSTSDV